jgi:hypothetical protein
MTPLGRIIAGIVALLAAALLAFFESQHGLPVIAWSFGGALIGVCMFLAFRKGKP